MFFGRGAVSRKKWKNLAVAKMRNEKKCQLRNVFHRREQSRKSGSARKLFSLQFLNSTPFYSLPSPTSPSFYISHFPQPLLFAKCLLISFKFLIKHLILSKQQNSKWRLSCSNYSRLIFNSLFSSLLGKAVFRQNVPLRKMLQPSRRGTRPAFLSASFRSGSVA